MSTYKINIKETLETQVTIEADNEEAALALARSRWRDSEYILDADNFVGVEFTPAEV